MSDLTLWQASLTSSWAQVWASVLAVIPKILGAIVVFVIGLLLAYWVKRLTVEVLRLVKADKLAESSGIDKYLKKAEVKHDFVALIGTIVEWLIILVFFLAVVDILGLSGVSSVLVSFLSFVPNVFAAALILAVGYIVADVVEGVVKGALVSVDHDVAKPVGKLSRWLLIIVAVFAAFDQLQIAQGLIATFFQGLTYTIVLVVGISLGLGSKDLVAKILDEWYEKVRK